MNPFFLTSLLFAFLAVFGALEAAGVSLALFPSFPGLRWMRVHFITLGIVAEAMFGLLPILAARARNLPRPNVRLDIWLALTMGVITLIFGIPLTNMVIITTGGALVFIAVLMLIGELRKPAGEKGSGGPSGRRFYIVGLVYLLLGIFVGAGLWFGWPGRVGMRTPLEVHIHANNWGFLSLVFAGLMVDLYPKFMGRPFAWPASIEKIFWLMTLGAFGLVLGPWTGLMVFTVPGLLMHVAGTVWLLLNLIKPLLGTDELRKPGPWHLLTAYIWILAPILSAPLVLFKVAGFQGAGIEANAPQALVYGWVLQFAFPLLPFLFSGEKEAGLGGSWASLWLGHAGAVLLWVSIFLDPVQGLLQGLAYVSWALAFLPVLGQMWRRASMAWRKSSVSA